MNHHYGDIRSRIPEPPVWFDENAVPRWSTFGPRETADIYAKECCLALIECQNCGEEFHVAFAWSSWDVVTKKREKALSESVKDLHFGDPPNVECCPSGPTMNSVPRRVLEFWQQVKYEWVRRPDLEVAIDCDWAEDPLEAGPCTTSAPTGEKT